MSIIDVKKLKDYMKRQSRMNKGLAELLKITESGISRKLSGEIEFTLDEAKKIIDYLNCNCKDILTDDYNSLLDELLKAKKVYTVFDLLVKSKT